MRYFYGLIFLLTIFAGCSNVQKCQYPKKNPNIKQITFAPQNHYLGVYNPWSPDDNWIVYSCGPNHSNNLIQKVNIETGAIVTLYEIDNQKDCSPGCGTASYCKTQDKVIFIHGPRKCNEDLKYEFWRRSAAAIEEPNYNAPVFLDARDVTYPYTPGALRGGTHCHQWSVDGQWVTFTYNDMIMAQLEEKSGQIRDLRTIGISKNLRPVEVDHDQRNENFNGMWFSVLLAEVTANPKPGTDDISRAYENCWVGNKGYKNKKGLWQRAVVFKGNVVANDGKTVAEIFLIDIPEKIDIACAGKPLEGTRTHMPFPPSDTHYKRLTYTANNCFPRLTSKPRYWLSSSKKGDKIFFLARDEKGINQAYYISPLQGSINKITSNSSDIVSSLSVNSNDSKICYICDGSIFVTEIQTQKTLRLTSKADFEPYNPKWSNEGQSIVFNNPVSNSKKTFAQIFIITNND